MDVLLTFNRLKQLTTDKAAIVAAVKDSEIVDVSEDSEKIRRNPAVPIPENSLEFWQEVKTRTVYIVSYTMFIEQLLYLFFIIIERLSTRDNT